MSKINKHWENPKNKDGVHSPSGVIELRKSVKYGLQKKYKGMAESMYRWEFPEGFEDMKVMSQNTMPEYVLMKNGQAVVFKDEPTGQFHILPYTFINGINMYGKPVEWNPMPIGWTDTLVGDRPASIERIRNLRLNAENSVILKNDLFGGNDEKYIDAMIDELVDNTLTMNQLQLIAKAPFVFNVTEDNLLSAQQFFLSMSQDKPAIFTNVLGDGVQPVLESTNAKIDPALFELFDRFECQILEYLGIECVPITKRAQQTVSEVQSNDDKIYLRRMEKLNQRQLACDRMKELWGIDVKVYSVLDERVTEEGDDDADNGRDE